MSTKIYNGYKARVLNIYELNEFYKDVRKISNNEMERKYYDLLARKMLKIAYDLERVKDDDEKIETYLLNLYFDSVFSDNSEFVKSSKEEIVNNVKNKYIYNKYIEKIKSIAESIIMNKSMQCVFKSKNSPFYFKSEFALLPLEDKVLVLVYDNDTCSELTKNKEFCEKYGFEYYGYWDNTDKPDEISEKEWEQRKKDWDNIKKTPAEECICFSCGFETSIEFPMIFGDENKEKIIDSIKNNIKKEQQHEAFDIAITKWCLKNGIDNASISDVLKFDKLNKNKDSEVIKLIYEAEKEVNKKFGWIDERIINYSVKDILEQK